MVFRRGALTVFCLLAASPCACLAGPASLPAFQPQFKETGGPKALYSIRADQLAVLFPIGSTLDQIVLKYGKPTMSGSGVDQSGKATSWAVYTYGRTYTHVDTKFRIIAVNRFNSATLQFDVAGTLREVSLSKYQNFSTASENREATDEEVAQYLGAPVPLDLKVDPPAASGTKTVPSPNAWKLGVDISELRSEYAARTGYTGRGVYVVTVDPQGLAARAGLQPGDVLVKLNGVATPTRDDLVDQLKATPVTSPLNLDVFSQGRLRTVTVPAQKAEEGAISI